MTPGKERQLAWRERLWQRGLMQISLVVPIARATELRELAERWRKEREDKTQEDK